jgi:hypothetical protein
VPAPAEGLLPMTFAVVTVPELNVRVAPSASADLLEAMFVEMPLPRGSRLLNLGDAINAEGYLWYLVGILTEAGAPVGWVASGPPEDPWLQPDTRECPPANLATISALTPVERFGCFAGRSVGFEGRQMTAPEDVGFGGVCGGEDPGGPDWLVCENYNWVHVDGDPDKSLNLYFDPATGIEPTGLADPGTVGQLWTIQGHFGDAAASRCGGALEPTSLDYQAARLECATLFVVEELSPAE